MKLSELSIRRPVLATVFNLVIILLGLVAWQRLQLREYPNIDVPTISVETNWRGASAEIMESQVTKILEDSISGIEGIDFISSTTRSEQSQINVTFKLNRDASEAAADVRDRVGRVRGQLPDAVDEPVIAKTQADATPIIWLALSSDSVSEMQVSDIADRVVQDRLQTLEGVANAQIFGTRRYAMRLWLDPQKLATFKLTPTDISAALQSQNIEVPAGRIEGQDREFTVLAETDLKTPEQFSAIILKQNKEALVRLGDVARVEIAPEDTRVISRYNNKSAVAVGIVKQSTANPLDVSRLVQKEIVQINKMLPAGVTLTTAYDSTVFIDASLNAVIKTIFEAIALVAVVIFLFLRSGRASIIPLITIPISLLGALGLMLVLGFSLNTLSLLAFVLAIGLVVDDAIVMLENIARNIEEGIKPLEAALQGSREIGFAVVAMTLTLAAVYAPIGMAEGRTGKLFTEFALSLAGAVLVSGFIALTLTPMLCSKLLKPTVHATVQEPFYVRWYRQKLLNSLSRRVRTLSLAGLSLFFSLWLVFGAYGLFNTLSMGALNKPLEKAREFVTGMQGLKGGLDQGYPIEAPAVIKWIANKSAYLNILVNGLPNELSPVEDRGFFIGVGFAPEGSTIDYTTHYSKQIEAVYDTIPEHKMHFVVNGFPVVNQMLSFVVMKDWAERDRSVAQIAAKVGGAMFGVGGLMSFPVNPPSLGQDLLNSPVTFILQTTGTWEELNEAVMQVMMQASQNTSLQNLRPDLQLNKPELRLQLNRNKAALMGVDVAEIGRTLELMLGGAKITRFKQDGEQYDVMVQLDPAKRQQPTDLTGIFVRNKAGSMVQLANLVTVQETVTPKELNHFGKLRSATITATLAQGYSLGQALDYLNGIVEKLPNKNLSVEYGGGSRDFMESSSTIMFVFVLALAFIFLVLAAQFESFIDPLIILVTVPLAIFGALVGLFLSGGSLNIYSQIGLVTLVGLIAKNGILIVEFANQLVETGKTRLDAVQEAALLRLRPILMTTAATVFGAVPLALAHGAGAEARQTIGWVIVGGMTIGTLFTLFVLPTLYVMMGRQRLSNQ